MVTLSGSYRETNIATIAAMIVLINAHLAAENARMIVLGGAATKITGNIVLSVKANNGLAESYTHKIMVTLNCPTLADTATLTAALSTFATAVETESEYTTVVVVDVAMNTVMTN